MILTLTSPPQLKSASTISADPGETITYTIQLTNTGGASGATIFLTDTLPTGLNYIPGTLQVTDGKVDDSDNPRMYWQGGVSPSRSVQITYQASVQTDWTGRLDQSGADFR